MGLIDSLFGNLLGGGGKQASPDWAQIEKLMQMEADLNRTNRQGIFGGWDWQENPDGSWTQYQTLAPGMQVGADRLLARATQGMGDYQSPSQFGSMLDAMMANQYDRLGLTGGNRPPTEQYGPPSASRPGLFEQTPQLPPEAQQPPAGQPPVNMQQPGYAQALQQMMGMYPGGGGTGGFPGLTRPR